MNLKNYFQYSIGTIGITLLVISSFIESFKIMNNFTLITLFLLLAILLERMTIPLPKGALTLSFAFILCTFYVFSSVALPVWIVVTGSIISQLLFHKRKIIDVFFNAGIISTSILCGGFVFDLLGGTWDSIQQLSILPLIIMVSTILLVNNTILAIFYKITDTKYSIANLLYDVKWDAMTYLVTVPLGLIMVYAYDLAKILGVLIIFVPLITSSYVFRLYKKMDKLNYQLNGLYEVATDINSNLDMGKTLSSIGEHLYELINLDSFYILLVEDNYLKSVYGKGSMVEYLENANLKMGEGASGYCAQHKKTVLIQDVLKDQRILALNPKGQEGAIVSVPLLRQGKILGVLTGVRDKKNSFTDTEVLLLEIMASQAAVALDNAKAFKEIESMAIIDELTKAYNYRYFQQKIHQEVEKAALEGSSVSLMVIDLDDFKRINDTHGHTVGNKVLIEFAQVLRKAIRKYDVLFRYGGDEFVIVLPNTDKIMAEKIGIRILESVNTAFFAVSEGINETVTFSAGIAEFPEDAEDHLDLMRKADRTMYVGSKEQGKNRITVFAK